MAKNKQIEKYLNTPKNHRKFKEGLNLYLEFSIKKELKNKLVIGGDTPNNRATLESALTKLAEIDPKQIESEKEKIAEEKKEAKKNAEEKAEAEEKKLEEQKEAAKDLAKQRKVLIIGTGEKIAKAITENLFDNAFELVGPICVDLASEDEAEVFQEFIDFILIAAKNGLEELESVKIGFAALTERENIYIETLKTTAEAIEANNIKKANEAISLCEDESVKVALSSITNKIESLSTALSEAAKPDTKEDSSKKTQK